MNGERELRTFQRGEVTVSYVKAGSGPPLVLVHGSFSDHVTNWQEAWPFLTERFTVYAIARRGRGTTSATRGHTIADEADDVAALLHRINTPSFILGHSHGARCALNTALVVPSLIRKMVLYEPPGPTLINREVVARLEPMAAQGDWDRLVETFLTDVLRVPTSEVDAIKGTPYWQTWIDDAPASLGDFQAISRHEVAASAYRGLRIPVQLLVGSESLRELFFTDALSGALADARITALEGAAHEGMTTAPEQFVEAISEFLLSERLDDAKRGSSAA